MKSSRQRVNTRGKDPIDTALVFECYDSLTSLSVTCTLGLFLSTAK